MIVFTCPQIDMPQKNSVFLAGGITGCPDWQREIIGLFSASSISDFILYNPRRYSWPIDDPSASNFQIRWEHDRLRASSAVLFWFPCETLCPIVLYELGAWSMTNKPIFIGVHPEYKRRRDVEVQTRLARPDVRVVYSISDLAGKVSEYFMGSST